MWSERWDEVFGVELKSWIQAQSMGVASGIDIQVENGTSPV